MWKKQTDFYPGATVSNKPVNVGNYGSFYTNCSGESNVNSTVVYIPVNLTDISTLYIVGSTSGSGNSGRYAGAWLCNTVDAIRQWPYYTIGQGSEATYYERMSRYTNSAASFTWSWDVSGLTGTHYLALGAYYNGSGTGTAGITVTNVYGI